MTRDTAPQAVIDLADARSAARRAQDFATADRLKDEIEAAGWKVKDYASLYSLERATPPDIEDAGVVRYGASANVPSRLDEPASGSATVILEATDDDAALARSVAALLETAPPDTQLVIVANAPSASQAAALDGLVAGAAGRLPTEIVWTAARWGRAAALNAGIRRAAAPVVVLLQTGVEPRAGLVEGISAALADETVAVAGPAGLVSADLQRFTEAAAADGGTADVEAISGAALGFRRTDFAERGPLDEQFLVGDYLDAWWSLVLRDLGEDAGFDDDPRRAVRIAADTIARPDAPDDDVRGRERAAKKAFYRYLKYFANRRDLLAGEVGAEVRARLRGLA